jgi:hypothetical protein
MTDLTFHDVPRNIMVQIGVMEHMQLLFARLRVPQGQTTPFSFLNCHVGDKKAFVFVVKNGEAVTLEDDPDLFPSDALIGQLRLLIG